MAERLVWIAGIKDILTRVINVSHSSASHYYWNDQKFPSCMNVYVARTLRRGVLSPTRCFRLASASAAEIWHGSLLPIKTASPKEFRTDQPP